MTNDGADLLDFQLKATGITGYEREYRFCKRLWRLDFAWPAKMIVAEVNGGIYAAGRHSRGKGLEGDYEKLAEAAILGWRVIQVSTGQVKDGQALWWLERALK